MRSQLAPALSLVVALTIVLALELVASAPTGAFSISFHNYTFDHLVTVPLAAKRCGESGVATLAIAIDENGRVSEAHVANGSGYADLDVAATQSVLGWRYRTARTGGVNTFPHEVKVVFQAGDYAVRHDGECSASSVKVRAKAMEEAPLVNPARMPLGMQAPKFASSVTSEVDLGDARSVNCGPTATTHMYTVIIGADGSVRSFETHEQWGLPTLDMAATHFVKSLRFAPARSRGHSVQVSIYVFVTPRPVGAKGCVLRAE